MPDRPRLILVLGDQLSHDLSALAVADRARDIVVMAEVREEATYVRHHPKKIAFVFAAMRKHATSLEADGWQVAYSRLDDPDNSQSIVGELLRRAEETAAGEVLTTEAGEWRLLQRLAEMPLEVKVLPDDRFFCSGAEFAAWAEGRRELRMEWFYRQMRRKTGYLMAGDQPAGGRWNFDKENRRPADRDLFRNGPPEVKPDRITAEVLDLVEAGFEPYFGDLRPFAHATDRAGALAALADFIDHRLAEFGPYQDAMLQGDRVLNHSLLSACLNVGLLSPREVCDAAQAAWEAGKVPIQSAEGFIRQILGWREFVRGVYFLDGPDYVTRNVLRHDRDLPPLYWGGPTKMNCLSHAVRQTWEDAHAHHIQRLMLTGNFALLAGLSPQALHEWYLAVYIDAFEWVEAPNTIGMSQFADGGMVGSKPYVSSGNYIDRMSDYCGGCAYRVKDRTGPDACPFNLLYWAFLDRHRQRFEKNPRMAQMYRTWDRMDAGHRRTVLKEAADFLERMEAGEEV